MLLNKNHKKLLIVDDEGNLRKLLLVTLGYGRYKLYFAVNGTGALALAEEHEPEAIVLDIRMPGDIDGLEVCRRIKEHPKLKNTSLCYWRDLLKVRIGRLEWLFMRMFI